MAPHPWSDETVNDHTSVSLLYRVRDAGDSKSWSDFVQLYDGVVRRWLHSQGVQPADADDIVQEMTVVHREVPNFDHSGRPGAFRTWLRRVTANRLREFWRVRKTRAAGGTKLGDLAEKLEDGRSGVSRIWRQEHDRFVLEHLLSLVAGNFQPSSITAFRQIALQRRDAQQVADELGMTLGAVRVAQSRVLRALRELGEGLID